MLTNRQVREAVKLSLIGVVLWSFFFAATTGPVLAGLMVALNLSNPLIGLINSLVMACLPFQIIGAILQQRFFNRKRFWFGVVICYYVAYGLISALIASWSNVPRPVALIVFVSLFALAQIAVQLGTSIRLAWLGEIIPPRESNTYWNRRTGVSQLCLLVTSICVGAVVDVLGREKLTTYAWIMFAGVAFGLLSLFVQYPIKDPSSDKRVSRISVISRLRLVWRNERFRLLLLFFGIQAAFAWLLIPFIFVYLQKNLGFDMLTVQILVGVSSVISFFSGYAFRVIGTKYGRKPIILLCAFLKGVEFMFWGLLIPGASWAMALPAFILGGFVNMGLLTSQLSLLTSIEWKKNQSFSIGVFFALIGLIGFISSSVSGGIYDCLESLQPFVGSGFGAFNLLAFIVAFGYFTSLAVFSKFREDGAIATVDVVRILLSNNPFRAIYHAHALAKPLREHSRVNVLNNAKGGLIADELLKDLYSPSSRVRESAIWNISRLGEKIPLELEDELLKLVDAPEFGLRAAAVRALGHVKSRKSVETLEKNLDAEDLTLTQACVFALGMIGDEHAVSKLEAILDRDRYRMVWPQTGEALGKLGNWRHTRQLYHVYHREFNWVLRKQLLIAVIRSFSRSSKADVYAAFENEEKTPTQPLEALIKAILLKLPEMESSRSEVTRLLNDVDSGDYGGVMEDLLTAFFNAISDSPFNVPLRRDTIEKSLNSLFSANGEVMRREFLKDTFRSVGLWLLVNLWAEVRYRPEEFNEYALLAFLLAMNDFLEQCLNPPITAGFIAAFCNSDRFRPVVGVTGKDEQKQLWGWKIVSEGTHQWI